MHDPYALEIHIDGSTYNNPGNNGGIAGIAEYPDELGREPQTIFKKRFSKTTNQRMELVACIEALKWIRRNVKGGEISRIIIFTDSQYLCENKYNAISWKKNHWKNKNGRPISNDDCWKDILSLMSKIKFRIEIMQERGKSSPMSKQVDKLAKNAAKSGLKLVDFGYHSGRVSRTKINGGVSLLFPAEKQEVIIRVYRHRYMKNVQKYEITFELFSEKDKSFIQKYYAYVSKKEKRKIHLRQYYKVKFNSNPVYPTFRVIKKYERKN